MVTDHQVRRLMSSLSKGHRLATAAARAGMAEKTARKYRQLGLLPSQAKTEHTWRTRADPFADVWPTLERLLQTNPGLQAKTLFTHLQRQHPGRFPDGQLRTLQRRVKRWRALAGPPKEVFFPQDYAPGERCQSDFTAMKALAVTIAGQTFDHLLYHFVLPYSNWETGAICFSESFESLSEGLQRALFKLGGAPRLHQTDRLRAAVCKARRPGEFTERYRALLRHYGIAPQATQPYAPHENGDVEQRHYRFKDALDQALMLRGSRDFARRSDYAAFLERLFDGLNAHRRERSEEERSRLRALPVQPLPNHQRLQVRVAPSSTITVKRNLYSVPARLIGERVEVRLFAERLEVHYGQRLVSELPRLRGAGKHRVDYRHVIDGLVRKPGAFAHYRWRSELFPTHRFRLAYDRLRRQHATEAGASKVYLRLLQLAAREGEQAAEAALTLLLDERTPITVEALERLVRLGLPSCPVREVEIRPVELARYDRLLRQPLQGTHGAGPAHGADPGADVRVATTEIVSSEVLP